MYFNKKIKFKKYLVIIKIRKNFFNIKNRYYFGFPVADKKIYEKKNTFSQVKNIKGYFFIIEIKKNSINFYTDIIGNFRIYYYKKNNSIIITDDLSEIYKIKNKKFKLDKKTFKFFELKNYTPGNKTFINDIFKLQPACKYEISNSDKISLKSYFPNHKNTTSLNLLLKRFHTNFIEQFRILKKNKIVLFFSGGKDSLLIFHYLIQMKIQFECLFYDTARESVITQSKKNVEEICEENNIKLRIIKIPLVVKPDFKNFFFKEMLFDYHYSLLHFTVFKKIKKIYNKDTVFITGQSSDSILSFGPSAYTVSNFIARYLNLFPNNILSKFFCKILNLKFKNQISASINHEDYLINFYNSFFYYSVNCKNNEQLKNYTKTIIKNLKIDKYKLISKKMYLKSHGFLQGPDNQVFIKTANYFKFNRILLPFANYQLIETIIKFYNFKIDLLFPKYIVDILLYKNIKKPIKFFIKNIFTKKNKNYRINLTLVNSKFKKKIIQIIKKKYEKKN